MLLVNTQSCDACGTCVAVCPCDALVLEEFVSVNVGKCSECGTCVRICPFGALSLKDKAVEEPIA